MWGRFWEAFVGASCCARVGLKSSGRRGRNGNAPAISKGHEQISPGILVEVVSASNVPDLDAPQNGPSAGARPRKTLPGEAKRPWLVDGDSRSDVYVSVTVLRALDDLSLARSPEAESSAPSAAATEAAARHDGRLEAVSGTESTSLIWNSQNPVFHSWMRFPGVDSSSSGEVLLLDCRLTDYDQFTGNDPIGQILVPLSDFQEGEEMACKVSLAPGVSPLCESTGGEPEPLPCELVLRCLRAWPERKRVYLLRHGQSGWNKAMQERDVLGLASFDHPLSREGVDQGKAFNKAWTEPAEEGSLLARQQLEFKQASTVFSSPLTRAVQTCLLSLRGHPALGAGPVLLLACAREVQKAGGIDSVGTATGEAIEARVRGELVEAMGEAETAKVMTPICPYSCSTGEWWGRGGTSDSKQDVRARISQLMNTVMGAPGESCVVVGHSLLFSELFRDRCSPALSRRRPAAVERLAGVKLGNASCCSVDLGVNPGTGEIEIMDAHLLFGSCFEDGFGLDETLEPSERESLPVPEDGNYLEEDEDGMQRL